jgi:hypothetical protein
MYPHESVSNTAYQISVSCTYMLNNYAACTPAMLRAASRCTFSWQHHFLLHTRPAMQTKLYEKIPHHGLQNNLDMLDCT